MEYFCADVVHKKLEKMTTQEKMKDKPPENNTHNRRTFKENCGTDIVKDYNEKIGDVTGRNEANKESNNDLGSGLNDIHEKPLLTDREEGEITDNEFDGDHGLNSNKSTDHLKLKEVVKQEAATIPEETGREEKSSSITSPKNKTKTKSQNKTKTEKLKTDIRICRTSQRKRSDDTDSSKRDSENFRYKTVKRSNHVSNSNSQKSTSRIYNELNEDIERLKKKYSAFKAEITAEEENISFGDMKKFMLELNDMSYNLQSFQNLQMRRHRKEMLLSKSIMSVEKTDSNVVHQEQFHEKDCITAVEQCKCGARHCTCCERKTDDNETSFKDEHTLRCHSRECNGSYVSRKEPGALGPKERSSHGRCSQSPSNSTCKSLGQKSKERKINEKKTEEKRMRSLFNKQMDLINKHVSKTNDSAENVDKFGASLMDIDGCNKERKNTTEPCKKFGRKINNLEDMLLFVAFLRRQKRKQSEQKGICPKKAKTTSGTSATYDKLVDDGCETSLKQSDDIPQKVADVNPKKKTAKKKRINYGINYFSTQKSEVKNTADKEVNEIELLKTVNEEVSKEKCDSNEVCKGNVNTREHEENENKFGSETTTPKDKNNQTRFGSEITTLEDMDNFLTFLRENKKNLANKKEHCSEVHPAGNSGEIANNENSFLINEDIKKMSDPIKSTDKLEIPKTNKSTKFLYTFKETIPCSFPAETTAVPAYQETNKSVTEVQENISNKAKTRKSTCQTSLNPDDTVIKQKPLIQGSTKKHQQEDKIEGLYACNNTLFIKPKKFSKLWKLSKDKVNNIDTLRKKWHRIENSSNSVNEEASLGKMESFFQHPKTRNVEKETPGFGAMFLDEDKREDLFLRKNREKRKAKFMACVTVEPEKISKVLKDIRDEKFVERNDDLSKEYKKMMRKIVAETKVISNV